ncbi:TIP120 [Candida pseudojiufengensis]|uniref:TIP120 n=1 Tax=Candida pseudojiufengensis TaxID=497109 RepID=UPI002224191A|nr:TIP120 [Candida pseudojiufengensis]KAI5960943.1 TIP120 [Candida pseudojiufengensis]
MSEINFTSLNDRVLDVDPDIRFMALEDLRKFLTDESIATNKNAINNNLNNLIPKLLNMLSDANPDVQNQAIKSFEPMIKYLDNDSILNLVKKLFQLVQSTKSKSSSSSTNSNLKSFTVSVPNMALRSLFAQSNSREKSDFMSDKLSSSNFRFDRQLSKQIMDYLIPNITGGDTSIDNIELLIDLINELGYVLNQNELLKLGEYFINVSFKEQGIIGKKAVVGIERVVVLVKTVEGIDKLLDLAASTCLDSKLKNKSYILLQLYSVILQGGVHPSNVDQIYGFVMEIINSPIEFNEDEDIDYDLLEQQNALKDEAFTTLIDILQQNCLPTEHKNQIIDAIKKYLKYDPLHSDDEDLNIIDDDIEFSDEELGAGDDEEYDGSWKLRSKAAILIRVLLKSFPDTLDVISREILPLISLQDSNDQVAQESIKSCIAIIQATSPRDAQSLSPLSQVIVNRIASVKEEQLTSFLRLIESLNRFNNQPLIDEFFKTLNSRKIISSSSTDYLQFYSSVLKFHDNLNDETISRIAQDLATNINDKSFNLISESLKCLQVLFKNINDLSRISNLDTIINRLIDKIKNSKTYPSDLIRLSIICLGEALANKIHNEQEILEILKQSLIYDGTSKVTIDVLNNIYSNKQLESEYTQFVIEKLSNTYVLSSNEATSLSALILLDKAAEQSSPQDYDTLVKNLIQLLPVATPSNYHYIFKIFDNISSSALNDQNLTHLLDIIVKLVNDNKIDVDDQAFFTFLSKICQADASIYTKLGNSLNKSLEITAKTLATCASDDVKHELNTKMFNELRSISNTEDPNFAFLILFLGYSNDSAKYLNTQFIIDILQKSDFTNESNIQAASTALGLVAEKDVNSSVPAILHAFLQEKNTIVRGSLISALKVLITSCNLEQKLEIWQAIFNLPTKFDHSLIPELRKSGEILGRIAYSLDESTFKDIVENQEDERKIYLILVISKFLISNLENSNQNDKLLTFLVKSSIPWLDLVDVDIRQIGVGNLLTGIHSKPSIITPILNQLILPSLFKQLTAEPKFKKVITMGPYKYVLDQGLEIRKLCYEFIYSIMATDQASLNKNEVDLQLIAQKIIEHGLLDDQSDIIVLACINLINFFDLHEADAKTLIKSDDKVITKLISGLNTQLAKKLSAKASSQDTENHQERIKSIIKLTKKINNLFENMQNDYNEHQSKFDAWSKFNSDVKEKFNVFYSTTNV